MSKWTYIAILGGVILITGSLARFTGKATGAADLAAQSFDLTEQECVDRYAIPAATNFGVSAARIMCGELGDPNTTGERSAALGCILPKIPVAKSEAGVRLAVATCYQQHGGSRIKPPPGYVLDPTPTSSD